MKKIFTVLIFSMCTFSYTNNDLIIGKYNNSVILKDEKKEKSSLLILDKENLYSLKLDTKVTYKKNDSVIKEEDKQEQTTKNPIKYITNLMIEINKKTAYEVEKNKLEKQFVNYLLDLKNNELIGNKVFTNNNSLNSKIYLEFSNKQNNYSKYNIYEALDSYVFNKVSNISKNNNDVIKYLYIEKNYNRFDKIELGITNRKSILGEEIKYNINSKIYIKPII